MENLQLAESIARQGKSDQYGVHVFDRNPDGNLAELRDMLMYKEYTTGPYNVFTIKDPKEREVYGLSYYPHRIVQHAAMLPIERLFSNSFTADTYSCIKGRGIHAMDKAIKKALFDVPGTKYCLKIDVRKFYPSVDHDILKAQLRRKIKDEDFLWLLDDIIDSAPGIPIGNYISQFFSNFNLSPFDHWLKEKMRVKYYFRYCDDIVILADSKPYLHQLLAAIREYLWMNLKLQVKGNYQVFPVEGRGIDVIGYVYYHGYSLMRKRIKQNFARAVKRDASIPTIAAYWGWATHCNSNNFIKTIFKQVA